MVRGQIMKVAVIGKASAELIALLDAVGAELVDCRNESNNWDLPKLEIKPFSPPNSKSKFEQDQSWRGEGKRRKRSIR